jgi:hypothetical protein
MAGTSLYDAYWLPGLESEFDDDEAVDLGLDWLESVDCPGPGVIVMNAVLMQSYRSQIANSGFPIVSPQSRARAPGGIGKAVLAVWPDGRTLDMAERLATRGALCVIGGTLFDLRPWIKKSTATALVDGEALDPMNELDPMVTAALDGTLFFGGHNRFTGSHEKADAVRRMRMFLAAGHRPQPDEVEAYALASGETDHRGAAKLRGFYEGLLEGRGFRDSSGRPI